MAKKRVKKKVKIDHRRDFLATQMEVARKAFNNDNIYAASEHGKTLYGIPFPSVALEYIFTSNVFLMSKLTGLAGQKGSLKSSFGFEILRWFIDWYGLGVLVETENKASEQYLSILQEHAEYCQFAGVKSTQDAQKTVTFYEDKHSKDKKMAGVPLCIVIDSLTGSEGDKTKEAVAAVGHTVKGYSENALLWTSWLRAKSADLTAKPVALIFTNHLKEKIGGMVRPGMPPKKTTPGGVAQEFHATYYMHMTVKSSVSLADRKGKEVVMSSEKNSMGPDKRKIVLDFVWWYREDDAHNQLTYWDWYATTAKFLVEPSTPAGVRQVLGLKCTSKKYSSSILKFKDLTATQAGWFIENCPTARAALQAAMNIPLRYVWDDGELIKASDCDRKVKVNIPEGEITSDLIAQLEVFNEEAASNNVFETNRPALADDNVAEMSTDDEEEDADVEDKE